MTLPAYTPGTVVECSIGSTATVAAVEQLPGSQIVTLEYLDHDEAERLPAAQDLGPDVSEES